MTEQLYYEDSHIKSFDAVVTSCAPVGKYYDVTLDRTAFFPEGGGQSADTGVLGAARVTHTSLIDGDIFHRVDVPLAVGEEIHGEKDWEKRFSNMQNHTAEHIISGIIHRRFGYANVGFHMGEEGVIVDFDGFVAPDELAEVEREANRIVTENRRVTGRIVPPEELSGIEYRSKLDLKDNVRLVTIEGVDVCACCAPHVKATGEIGIIKIFESIRRKNGVRLRMLAGSAAYGDYVKRAESSNAISALLSAKQDSIVGAVERLISERDRLAYELGGLRRELIGRKAAELSDTDGNLLFFEPSFGQDELRLLVNLALVHCGGICGAFSGCDDEGYKYVLASRTRDLREMAGRLNSALSGRGGGTREMITGRFGASRDKIEEFFVSGVSL